MADEVAMDEFVDRKELGEVGDIAGVGGICDGVLVNGLFMVRPVVEEGCVAEDVDADASDG